MWEFSMPREENERRLTPKHNFTWAIIRSECSASCGGGYMNTKEACYKDMRIQVSTSFCNAKNRPITGRVPCNLQACTPGWSVGNWTTCSQKCGTGEQFRQIHCKQKANYKMEIVANKLCSAPPPAHWQTCNTQSCPPAWSIGTWSECSRTCGKGWRKRSVVCKSTNPSLRAQIVHDSACTSEFKPKTQENCLVKRCKSKELQWLVTSWSKCSVTCGIGFQKRTLQCIEKHVSGKSKDLSAKKCLHLEKPHVELERVCQQIECPRSPFQPVIIHPQGAWYSSPWSQCSASCGGGIQERTVQCLSHGRPSYGCLASPKPISSQACNTEFCPPEKKDLFCKDYYNWCHLVPHHGVCGHKFYGKQCCKSCSKSKL